MFDIYKNFPIKITITVMLLIITGFYLNEILKVEIVLFKPMFILLGVITIYFVTSAITDFTIWLSERKRKDAGKDANK